MAVPTKISKESLGNQCAAGSEFLQTAPVGDLWNYGSEAAAAMETPGRKMCQ